MTAKSVAGLIVAILACQAAGILGAMATRTSVSQWYPTLTKPPLTPPDWVFGPVWITLYVMMAVAIWLTWNRLPETGRLLQPVVWLFAAQLVLNAAWSIVFFGMRSPVGGLFIIVPLVLLIGLIIFQMAPVSRTAAWLMTPYLAWVGFATWLNGGIAWLN